MTIDFDFPTANALRSLYNDRREERDALLLRFANEIKKDEFPFNISLTFNENVIYNRDDIASVLKRAGYISVHQLTAPETGYFVVFEVTEIPRTEGIPKSHAFCDLLPSLKELAFTGSEKSVLQLSKRIAIALVNPYFKYLSDYSAVIYLTREEYAYCQIADCPLTAKLNANGLITKFQIRDGGCSNVMVVTIA